MKRDLTCVATLLFTVTTACNNSGVASRTAFIPDPPLIIRTTEAPATGDAREPELSSTSDGRIVLSWVEKLNDRRYALRTAVRDQNRWSGPMTVAEGDNWFINWADFPSVIGLTDGSLLLFFSTARGAAPDSRFDSYGAIRWEDEKARLDNFAIALSEMKDYVGYIFVVDSSGGCPGEATARAKRAKRYLTEHRGVPWGRVIWRREGYGDHLGTTLIIAPKAMILEYPFLDTSGVVAVDGPMTRACRAELLHIRKSRW